MAHTEIKKQLHSDIDMLEDETQLNILNESAVAYLTTHEDVLDTLTFKQKQRLQESILQADNGQTISNSEVKKRVKQWLTK